MSGFIRLETELKRFDFDLSSKNSIISEAMISIFLLIQRESGLVSKILPTEATQSSKDLFEIPRFPCSI